MPPSPPRFVSGDPQPKYRCKLPPCLSYIMQIVSEGFIGGLLRKDVVLICRKLVHHLRLVMRVGTWEWVWTNAWSLRDMIWLEGIPCCSGEENEAVLYIWIVLTCQLVLTSSVVLIATVPNITSRGVTCSIHLFWSLHTIVCLLRGEPGYNHSSVHYIEVGFQSK